MIDVLRIYGKIRKLWARIQEQKEEEEIEKEIVESVARFWVEIQNAKRQGLIKGENEEDREENRVQFAIKLEQMRKMNLKLCEECFIPMENRNRCEDCNINIEEITPVIYVQWK